MGIQGLQSFMESNHSIFYKIDILNLIKDIPQDQRTIVLDGLCCINPLYGNNFENKISNGQYQEFRQNVREFIQYFKQHNVKLVVFFDGTVVETKRPAWVKRRYSEQLKLIGILDALDKGDKINMYDIQLPPSLQTVADTEFMNSKCEVIYSSNRECDVEILEYANKNNSLAILSNDSDFAVSTGNWLYWSMKDLDLKTNSVYIYDRKAFARYLKLQEIQLPLLATLMGNDMITQDSLKRWHQRISYSNSYKPFVNRKKLFHEIASYIRNFNPNITNKDLQKISMDVFNKPEYRDIIRTSCNAYSGISHNDFSPKLQYDENWNAILVRTAELKKKYKINQQLYVTMNYHICNLNSCYEDFRITDLPLSGLLWRKLRAKIYGICFSNYTTGPVEIEEWISAGPGSLERPVYIKPIKHKFENFNLREIWSMNLSDEKQEMCWELFCTTIHEKLPVEAIRCLPQYLVPALLVLLWMWKPCNLQKQDFEHFLMVNIICKHNEIAVNLIDKKTVKINPKALRLACIYLRGIRTIEMLSDVCGWIIDGEYFNLANVYDGYLFHYFYSGRYIEEYRNHPDFVRCIEFVPNYRVMFLENDI